MFETQSIIVRVDSDCGISFELGCKIAHRLADGLRWSGMPRRGPLALHAVHIRMRHGTGRLAAILENREGNMLGAFREIAPGQWDHCPFDEWPLLERELDGGMMQ
jgi:hypothetical protein